MEHWKRTKIDKFNEIIGEIYVGDRVYGRSVEVGIPECGAVVACIWIERGEPDCVYVDYLDGSGTGILIKTDLTRYLTKLIDL